MRRQRKIYDGKLDEEYSAAFYILASSTALWEKAEEYIDRDGIDFEAMLTEVDLSGGESVLVKLAGNLFNGSEHIDPIEFLRLDDRNFRIALTSLLIRRSPLRLSELE